jgi:NCS1 family nucleobase:cation symporter-1
LRPGIKEQLAFSLDIHRAVGSNGGGIHGQLQKFRRGRVPRQPNRVDLLLSLAGRAERIARLTRAHAGRMRGRMTSTPALPNELLSDMLKSSALINADLAPIPPGRRTWSMWNIAALWVGMAICITTYTLASSLIEQGMNWKQAVITIFLGNLIVLIPMTLNAHPGTAYGIPFPVLIRASFGTLGSNIPALMRAFVACGWFGIQTWIGGAAIHAMLSIIFGIDPAQKTLLPIIGISAGEFLCFLVFWAINILVIIRGMDSIKWLEIFAAPFLILTGAGLLLWAVIAARGWGPIFAQPSQFHSLGEFWPVFTAGLTAMVGYWATLSLNIPDFSRFARSQRDQITGQALGLPLSMTFYAFIGVAVTAPPWLSSERRSGIQCN